jgi:hypothetical protein
MVASGNVVVNGNGATIDASALNDAFIVLDGTEEFAKKADGTDSDHKLIDAVTVQGVTIKEFTLEQNQRSVDVELSAGLYIATLVTGDADDRARTANVKFTVF